MQSWNHQFVMKFTLFLLFFLITSLSFNVSAVVFGKEPVEEVVDHPGKLELVYYDFIDQRPPLAPLRKVKADYKYFYVLPGVVTPSIQSVYLLEHTTIRPNEVVLDIGSGSGIQAIFAAEKAAFVVATDIDHAAVENTKFNVKGHNLENKIEVRQGDLFGPVKADEKFDVIILNISYPYDEKTQWLWEIHERFFKEASQYLKPGGRIYYQAGWAFNIPRILSMIQTNGFHVMKMNMVSALKFQREPIVFLIIRNPLNPDIPM